MKLIENIFHFFSIYKNDRQLSCEIYKNLSEEEKDKRRKNTREKHQNLTEEEKEKRRNKNLSEEKKSKSYLSMEEIII